MATYKILARSNKASRVLTLLAYKKLTAITLVVTSFVVVFGWNLAQVSASVRGVNEHVDVTSSDAIGNSVGN